MVEKCCHDKDHFSSCKGKDSQFLDLGWSCGKVAKQLGVTKSGVWKLGLRDRDEGKSVALKGKKGQCGRKKIVRHQDKNYSI